MGFKGWLKRWIKSALGNFYKEKSLLAMIIKYAVDNYNLGLNGKLPLEVSMGEHPHAGSFYGSN